MPETGTDGSIPTAQSMPCPVTENLRLRIHQPAPGVEVLEAAGDLDSHASSRFAESMRERFAQAPRAVVLDLSQVTLLSTAGVVALLEARHRGLTSGIVLRLVTGSRVVDRVFALLEVSDQFTYSTSVEAAVGTCAPPPPTRWPRASTGSGRFERG